MTIEPGKKINLYHLRKETDEIPISTRQGIPEDQKMRMRAYLHDERGWGALGYELVEVTDDRRRCDVVVHLLEAAGKWTGSMGSTNI